MNFRQSYNSWIVDSGRKKMEKRKKWTRAILSKNALISFIITFLVLFIAFLEFVHFPRFSINNMRDRYDAIYLFTRIRHSTKASILVLIAPLLASLAFSDSYLSDKESGFLKFIYLRIGQKKYIFSKIIVNSIVSGLVISLASFVMLFFLICVYGIKDVNTLNLGPFSWMKGFYCLIVCCSRVF